MDTTTGSTTGSRTKDFFRRRTPQGWERFAEKYGPKILAWCRRTGLSESDAEDMRQTVLVKLYEKWPTSSALWDPEKGSLRAWLRAVTRNAWCDACVKRKSALGPGRPDVDAVLENVADPTHFVEQFVRAELLQVAIDQTKARVTGPEWEVFRLRTSEGRSAKDVAEQLRLTVGTVNNYTSKVRKVLDDALKQLEGPSER